VKKKILIVDDDPDIRLVLERQLKKEGYETVSASDGDSGLEAVRRENPNLIILDLMLPKMTGYKVCESIKSSDKYKKIPVIMFTGKEEFMAEELGKSFGADIYLKKTLNQDEVISAAKKLLE